MILDPQPGIKHHTPCPLSPAQKHTEGFGQSLELPPPDLLLRADINLQNGLLLTIQETTRVQRSIVTLNGNNPPQQPRLLVPVWRKLKTGASRNHTTKQEPHLREHTGPPPISGREIWWRHGKKQSSIFLRPISPRT